MAQQSYITQSEVFLKTIQQTQYAEATAKHQRAYIAGLEKELTELEEKLILYQRNTQIDKENLEAFQKSHFKRLASKFGSKSKQKYISETEQEEKAYFEALEKENSAKERRTSINTALSEARTKLKSYEQDETKHRHAQEDLDKLYNTLFSGPTPEHRQEDEVERRFTRIREQYNIVEEKHRALTQAESILEQATWHAAKCAERMKEARWASGHDSINTERSQETYGRYGHPFVDTKYNGYSYKLDNTKERACLTRAESEAYQVMNLVGQAARLTPEVRELPHFEIASSHILNDVMFDAYAIDGAFHKKIVASQAEVLAIQETVTEQFITLKGFVASHKDVLQTDKEKLEAVRKELQDIRTEILRGAPPSY